VKNRFLLVALLLLASALDRKLISQSHSYDQLNRQILTDYGNGRTITYTYDAAGNRTSQVIASPPVGPIRASIKVFLEGPFNTSTNQMNKSLNTGGYLASHFSSATIPIDAVDSITVEIRSTPSGLAPSGSSSRDAAKAASEFDANEDAVAARMAEEKKDRSQNPDNPLLIEQRPAWLMADGTIRDFLDPTKSYVEFSPAPGNFYLVVRHRNHLAIMSATAQALTNSTPSQPYDFTTSQGQAYGTEPMKLVGTKYCMYAGDVNGDGIIKYNLSGNDRAPILVRIGGTNINATVSGYYNEDVNMDGVVKYNLSGNDRGIILQNIGGVNINATRSTQVP